MFDHGSQDSQSPVVQYLNWQIEEHQRMLDELERKLERFVQDHQNPELELGISMIEFSERTVERARQLKKQKESLERERLRLIGDWDFYGENYMTR
jgi:hypothetical protein